MYKGNPRLAERILRVERDGRVLTAWLDVPPRNLLGSEMLEQLDALTAALEHDRSVGAVILASAIDGVFVTHADTHELLARASAVPRGPSYRQARALGMLGPLWRVPAVRRALADTPLAGLLALRRANDVFARMNRSDKVYVAAINGMALGGGLILALACDLRLLAEGPHRIGLVESSLGFVAGASGTQRLARLVGPGRALDLLLDGKLLAPDEALRLGVVDRVVPATELLDAASELAHRLARRSPRVVRELKRCVYEAGALHPRRGLRIEEASFLATLSSRASRRALRAYHAELGPFARASNRDLISVWERLRAGSALDMTAE